MKVTEKTITKKAVMKQQNRFLFMILAVLLLFICVTLLVWIITSNGEQLTLQKQQIAQLQEELDTEKGKNDALSQENETLKSQVESLEKENDALKIEVSRKGGAFPASAYEGKKLVALTFDDGPGKYTAELLDFLKEHRVRATFFLLGTNAAKNPTIIQRMDADGHAIGNHSYSHPNLTKLSASAVAKQIGNCNAAIYKAIGRNASVLRAPGGNTNILVRNVAKNADLPLVYWSVDTKDWQSRDKDKILEIAFGEKGIKDGSIVLLHDVYRESVDAAKEMVLRLEKEGYTFVTVPELLSVRGEGMQAGKSYSNGY